MLKAPSRRSGDAPERVALAAVKKKLKIAGIFRCPGKIR